MPDRENVIKELEEAELMLKQAFDSGEEMAVMAAFKCYNRVSDALALLKVKETVVHPEPSCEMTYFTDCCCDLCGVQLIREDNFCRCCGKPIVWEDR